MSTYILNSWEIMKIVLAKQNSYSNETKMNNNKIFFILPSKWKIYAIKHLN